MSQFNILLLNNFHKLCHITCIFNVDLFYIIAIKTKTHPLLKKLATTFPFANFIQCMNN